MTFWQFLSEPWAGLAIGFCVVLFAGATVALVDALRGMKR